MDIVMLSIQTMVMNGYIAEENVLCRLIEYSVCKK